MNDPADLRRAKRIVIVARTNGVSGITMGVLAITASLFARDALATVASCGICAGAALEILGATRAARHDPQAPGLLVASQVVALTSVLSLVLRCAVAFSPSVALGWLPVSTRETITLLYPDPVEAGAFMRIGLRVVLGSVALVATLFEGGMAIFYGTSKGLFERLASSKSTGK